MKKNFILALLLIVAVSMGGSKVLAASFQSEAGGKAAAAPTATLTPIPHTRSVESCHPD